MMDEESAAAEVQRFTTAPESYDGFSTRTVREAGRDGDQVIREVAIYPAYVDWQAGRYASGGYPCLTREELGGLRSLPWVALSE